MSVDWVGGYAELCGGGGGGGAMGNMMCGPGRTFYICFGGLFAPSGLTAGAIVCTTASCGKPKEE